MEFLKENRNIVILIAIIVIGYLLLQTEAIKKLMNSLSIRWNSLSTMMKIILVLIVVYIAYYLYNNSD